MTSNKILNRILGCLLGAAFLWTSWNIWRYGVDIPFQDGWEFFDRYQALKAGTFQLSDLTRAHNEHRIFIPMVLLTLNALVFDWNIKATLLFSAILAALTALELIWLASATLKQRSLDYALVSIIIIIQIFNMAQAANWLWEWDFQWFVANVLAVSAIVSLFLAALKEKTSIYIFLAAVFSFAASFSLASGLCLWPLGLVYLLIEPKLRKFSTVWFIAGVGVFALYFYGLPPSNYPPAPGFTKWLPMIAEFTARFLGSTLQSGSMWGSALIVIGAAASLVCLATKSIRSRALPWIGLAAYAGGGALMAGVGRAHWLGPQSGGETRYSTLAGIFVLAVSATVIIAAQQKIARRAAATFVIVMTMQSAIHYPAGYAGFFWLSDRLSAGRACLMKGSPDDECIGMLYFPNGIESVKDRWQKLRRLNWRGTH